MTTCMMLSHTVLCVMCCICLSEIAERFHQALIFCFSFHFISVFSSDSISDQCAMQPQLAGFQMHFVIVCEKQSLLSSFPCFTNQAEHITAHRYFKST